MAEQKTRTFKCPHCDKVMTMTDFEISGMDMLMGMMPGPRLVHPEGTTACKHCEKPIQIQAIMAGKYDVPSAAGGICALLVVAALIAGGVYHFFFS
jgi:hypothetical protein